MKKHIASFIFLCLLFRLSLSAQNKIISGPMLGFCEHRSALIWVEVSIQVNKVSVLYREKTIKDDWAEKIYTGELHRAFNPIKFILENLKPATEYEYKIRVDNEEVKALKIFSLKTKNTDRTDFSFLFGSCAYINNNYNDRSKDAYGKSTDIFNSMANDNADFMVWMGDNTYLRPGDYSSLSGMEYRYSHDRATPDMQPLFSEMPNYALWDDHDYGENDASKSFRLKESSLQVFKEYWGNSTYGEYDNPAAYTSFKYSDCEFFLLDDRFFRSPDEMKDSIDGKPDATRTYFGQKQLQWLFNNMMTSNATFKFIINGNQLLNPCKIIGESLYQYSYEYNQLLEFITKYKINGVFCLSGDRHFAQLIKVQPKGFYPLYDYTSSPLTSTPYAPELYEELHNPNCVEGSINAIQNYGKITVSGEKGKRNIKLETKDIKGKAVYTFSVNENDLKAK